MEKNKKDPKKKERSKAYEKKLKIEGTLDDVLKVSVPKKKDGNWPMLVELAQVQ